MHNPLDQAIVGKGYELASIAEMYSVLEELFDKVYQSWGEGGMFWYSNWFLEK